MTSLGASRRRLRLALGLAFGLAPGLLWVGACVEPDAEAGTAPLVLAAAQELPEQAGLPPLLRSFVDGGEVKSAEVFAGPRSDELRAFFDHYVYGRAVDVEVAGDVVVVAEASGIDGLDVDYVELEVPTSLGAPLFVAIFRLRAVARPGVGHAGGIALARQRGRASVVDRGGLSPLVHGPPRDLYRP